MGRGAVGASVSKSRTQTLVSKACLLGGNGFCRGSFPVSQATTGGLLRRRQAWNSCLGACAARRGHWLDTPGGGELGRGCQWTSVVGLVGPWGPLASDPSFFKNLRPISLPRTLAARRTEKTKGKGRGRVRPAPPRCLLKDLEGVTGSLEVLEATVSFCFCFFFPCL